MSTQFVEPSDDQWDERPKGITSHVSRSLGWVMAIVWIAVITGYGLWQALTAPEGLFEKLLLVGGLSAFGLLFLSVLLDRIKSGRSDRYREVEK